MSYDDDKKNSRWSDYWKQGFVTSFADAAPANYHPSAKAFWYRHFESLRDESVILDLATGNGAIAIMAVEYSEGLSKNFTVLAADAAVISSSLVKESKALNKYRDKIKFFSSTPCEQLPFDDTSVDMVCSQFGIEYSRLSDSIPEVSRVLRDDGKFTAVMHHQAAMIVAEALRDQTILVDALHDHKILDVLHQYFKVFGSAPDAASVQVARQKPEVVNCEKKLFSVASSLREKYTGSEAVEKLLINISKFTSAHIMWPEEERLASLEGFRDSYLGMIERLQDMQNAAMSLEAMIELQRLATQSGLKDFAFEKIMNSSKLIGGWAVKAHK